MEWITAALAAFALIVPVELPDKTFVATLVLATRYKPWPVWIGVTLAFGVQCLVAVAIGRAISLLPRGPVQIVAALLFVIGAIVLFWGARKVDAKVDEEEQKYEQKVKGDRTGWRAASGQLPGAVPAEWGDLSQLLTASLVAAGRPAVPVFVGLLARADPGRRDRRTARPGPARHIRLSIIRYVGAGVCAVLAGITAIAALQSA